MYKVAIFDLDGTIADTVVSIATACNLALEDCGLKGRPVEEYNHFAGDGVQVLVKRALEAAGDTTGQQLDYALERYLHHFQEYSLYKVKPYEGIIEVLDYMKHIGMKIAVLTNKPHKSAVLVVETIFGKGYFNLILGQQESLAKKPDPEGAYVIASNFMVDPSECIYIGDTDVDMETGNAAGMYTVGVLWGFRDKEELVNYNAHALVEKPKDLVKFIV